MADRFSFASVFKLGRIKATSFAAVGKPGVEASTEIAKPVLGAAAGGAAALESSLVNMVFFGGFGLVSAITNQIEYWGERDEITNFYREELAAKNHKAQNQVVDADLTAAEKTNSTINEAVGRERSFRNLGIAASFVASVAVYALIHAVAPELHLAWSLPFAAKVAVSVLTYVSIKSPLMKAGAAFFGLNKDITHDLIEEISKDRERGKAITREQVVEVFVSGNKQLANYVQQTFGREYDELALADKVRLSAELANVIPVDKIVHNINLGTAKASELAYTVQGDISGALPKVPERKKEPSFLEKCVEQCKQAARSVTGLFSSEKANPIPAISAINRAQKEFETRPAPQAEESPVVEFNNTPSFVERLGRAPRDAGKGHVEQLAERSAQNVMMPGSATLQ